MLAAQGSQPYIILMSKMVCSHVSWIQFLTHIAKPHVGQTVEATFLKEQSCCFLSLTARMLRPLIIVDY